MEINEATLNDLLDQALVDYGAAMQAGLIVIGDRLGLYEALAEADGPLTSAELAALTGTAERYVREWLRAQAASGYVTYLADPDEPDTDRFEMTPEQALILADEDSPAFLAGAFQSAVGALDVLPQLTDAFRNGRGVGWEEHSHDLFEGVERMFRPSYLHDLVPEWIPALDGVEAKLERGAHVADVGCGYGASTIIMARAYPHSTFVGYDFHAASIETARERAEAAGVADRVRFEVASAQTFDGGPYDLVTVFDCLHDLGDPVGAAAHVRTQLAADGTWLIVEPYAADRLEDNLNPIGRASYAASTMICVPCSLDQEVGLALGAQAGETRLREVVTAGGFSRFRRVDETPFNLILEARP